ncbi:MAG: SDR family oxidoreductase [Chloroflexota bacterium]|nr:SDR family oxidoreductase [Chloroflexota bacterium]
MEGLNGKRALVTGAGMGIGQGIASELARHGVAVAVHYAHSDVGARETVARIEADGGQAVALGGDLTQVAVCRQVVDAAAAALGGLDLLVNNAGVTLSADVAETTETDYDALFALNVRAAFFCIQHALPFLASGQDAAILNITSIHGAAGLPRHAAYAATKGALIALTRELAIELADRRIRVNAIGPGLIEVPRYFDIPGYTTEAGDRMVPWGRIGNPEDVGRAAAWLLSPAAEFVTGQVLFVDGGTQARMGLWWDQTGEG